jgi:hypothetical protein
MEPAKTSNGGYEKSDATLLSVVLLVALTLGLAVVGVISMYFLYGVVIGYLADHDAPPSPLAETRAAYTGPRLQVSPPLDMKEMEAAEEDVLASYDWIDRDQGTVRIPIERAMDLVAERGLPLREETSASNEE